MSSRQIFFEAWQGQECDELGIEPAQHRRMVDAAYHNSEVSGETFAAEYLKLRAVAEKHAVEIAAYNERRFIELLAGRKG